TSRRISMHNSCSKQLDDAIELLTMVEQLLDGMNAAKAENKRLPLRGIRLSVSQAKRLVARAQEAVDQETEPAVKPVDRSPGLALAGRVTIAPTLGGGVSAGGRRVKGR